MIKVIIFDYDGVIVDSFQNVYEVYREICRELKIAHPKTIEEFRKIYGYNFIECYKNLGIEEKDYKKAQNVFKREILKKTPELFNGIKRAIKELSKNYKLVVVSANLHEEVLQKLKKTGIAKYFSDILGSESHSRFFKFKVIKNVIKKYNIKNDEVVFIDDRDVGYDAGKKAGLKNIILADYGWGHNKNGIIFKKMRVKKPLDILKVIKIINKKYEK